MLTVTMKSHRPYLRAGAGVQKLFVLLTMVPDPKTSRPGTHLALVVDTSGSMREPAPVTVDGQTYNATYREPANWIWRWRQDAGLSRVQI